MRVALLALLLLAPTAGASWAVSIEAPERAGAGLPFLVAVCGEAQARGQLRVTASNATLDVREDRYLPGFDARACRDVVVTPEGGEVTLEAKVRAEGGTTAKARALAQVRIEEFPFVVSSRAWVGDLRAPLVDGFALLPAFDGAPGPRVGIIEVRAPPQEGVILANEGAVPAPLAVYRLNGARVSNATLAPGDALFVPTNVKAGALTLTAGARNESWVHVPKLKPGEGTLGRYGRSHVAALPMRVAGDIVAFATPEAGAGAIVALIDMARREVLVEAYTLTSPDIAAALVRALDRGAEVTVLLEGAPVGGVPAAERALVATLQARGAQVFELGGEGARYRTVHTKAIVVDREALAISTENFRDAASRGYGLVVHNATLAEALADVIRFDVAGFDVAPFDARAAPADATPFVREPPPVSVFSGVRNVTLVLSPDDPGAIARLVATARVSVGVEMLRADAEGPMINALLVAAREGARVRLLLDGRHDDGVNRETAARLTAIAAREGLDLEATLDRAERTLHAKAVVVDARAVYVGSMNWVRPAIEDNREAGLIVDDPALAAWLEKEMEKDRTGPGEVRRVPAPPVIGAVLAAMMFTRGRLRPFRQA